MKATLVIGGSLSARSFRSRPEESSAEGALLNQVAFIVFIDMY
jgi:hypothetical protein